MSGSFWPNFGRRVGARHTRNVLNLAWGRAWPASWGLGPIRIIKSRPLAAAGVGYRWFFIKDSRFSEIEKPNDMSMSNLTCQNVESKGHFGQKWPL